MKKVFFIIFYFMYCNFLPCFAESLQKSRDSKINIAVSIEPLIFFIQQIAKDKVSVQAIVPQNKNPETYEPTIQDMSAISKAEMFFTINMPFEKAWIPKILKSTQNNIKVIHLESKLNNNHSPHLWLSIKNAKKISQIITQNIIDLDSKNEKFYKENLTILLQNLENLEAKSHKILSNMPKKDFITYHPLFDEFASEYGLNEHSLEIHGKKYGLQDIINLSNLGKSLGIKTILTQSENKDVKTLANSMNAKIQLINPLSKDYINNLESIFNEIAKSYE